MLYLPVYDVSKKIPIPPPAFLDLHSISIVSNVSLHHLRALLLSLWILLCHWQVRCVHTYIHFIYSFSYSAIVKNGLCYIHSPYHRLLLCSIMISVCFDTLCCFNKLVLNCSPVVSSKSVYHYRRTNLKTTHQQQSESRSFPGSCWCTSPHTHHANHLSCRTNHRSLTHRYCQSHGHSSALLWFGGGMQTVSPSVLSGPGDAAAAIPHWKGKDFFHNFSSEGMTAPMGWDNMAPKWPSHPILRQLFLYLLYHLKQGNNSINDFALRFHTLAAASGWLLTTYRQGLEPKLRQHLDSMGLEKFVQLSIRVTQRMQGCMVHQQSQSAVPLISPPTRVCQRSRTRCGLHASWDHPSNPGWAAMSARALPVSWC